MLKIHYPSFWKVHDISVDGIASFTSPLEHTGVVVSSIPTPGKSADEVLTNLLVKINKFLPNAIVTNTNISFIEDGSAIQTLSFTFGDSSNSDLYKAFVIMKTIKDETFIFIYYSTNYLFERFFPLASQMYQSYQIPSFSNVFPADLLIETPLTKDSNGQSTSTQDRLLMYKNTKLGLEIQYPNWLNTSEQERGVEFVFPNGQAGAILASSTINTASNESYVETHLLYLNESLDNFYVINTSRTDLMGYPTEKFMFTYENDTMLYKAMQFWNIKDNQARLFTYFAPSELFDDFLPTIDRMLKTIRVS